MKKELNTVLLFAIDQASRAAKNHSQREFDKHNMGITVEQWVLLKIIEESGSLSQAELAARSLKDPAAITRTLDILERKELLIREMVPGNRRQFNVKLTKKGLAFIQQHMELVNRLRKESTAGISRPDIERMLVLLERIRNNMS